MSQEKATLKNMRKPREQRVKQYTMQKIVKDLWMAAEEPPEGTVLPELDYQEKLK